MCEFKSLREERMMGGIAEAHVVPVEWRKKYCDAITGGDLLEFKYILEICDDKIFFPIVSAKGCPCWSVPLDHARSTLGTISYPQCQRLAERICSGTCDCTNTWRGRFVWFTSLHLACYYGQMEIVKCLMRFCQTAAQFQDKTFLTSLMVTSLSNAKDVAPSIASLLIDGGANIDEQVEYGFSPLHFAVINNNAELVKFYLQRDVSIDAPGLSSMFRFLNMAQKAVPVAEKCGLSPLWFAAKFLPPGSHCEELLLASGACVTSSYTELCPLVAVGSKEGLEGILRYIKSPGFDINHNDRYEGSQLLNAIRAHDYKLDDENRKMWFQVMKHYLEMGIDVNAEADSGHTAVFGFPDYEILELLISYGADLNHRTYEGFTALMEVYIIDPPNPLGTRSCARLLLENGADPNAVCNNGFNALVYALKYSCCNIAHIRLLFEYNMDVDVSYVFSKHDRPMRMSLLYTAYDYEKFEVAELCLQYGLDMTKQNWLLDTAHLPLGLRGNDDLYKKLLHLYQNPADLSVLARNKVRRLLGRDVGKTVTQLGLPKRLESFVCCK